MPKDCTCVASCRGKEGLSDGWVCVLDEVKRHATVKVAERMPDGTVQVTEHFRPFPPYPFVSLWHGMGFAGSDYNMRVGEAFYRLNERSNSGGPGAEADAKRVAKSILAAKHPELTVDLEAMPFRWNGCM